jgi:hypothetical protein
MDKFRRGWHKLFLKLDAFEFKESVDTKNFDGSLYAELLWRLAEFRFSFLARRFRTFENMLRIYNYYDALINTLIILPDGSVIQKSDGMPSGVYTTSSDDTLLNEVLIYFAYLKSGGIVDYEFFHKHFVAALYGDDNGFSYDHVLSHYFNGSIMANVLKETFGTIITGFGVRDWSEFSFLSHKFIEKDGILIPGLDPQRLICSQLIGSNDIVKSAERASAFRLLAWPYDYYFELFSEYLQMLLNRVEYIPRALYNCTQDIEDLYLSPESLSGRPERLVLKENEYDENEITKTPCKATTTTTTTTTFTTAHTSKTSAESSCSDKWRSCGSSYV